MPADSSAASSPVSSPTSSATQASLLPETQPVYCDVALPVPLDALFTYEAGELEPIAGGRVVVPFGRGAEKKLSGIVTRIHHEARQPAASSSACCRCSILLPVLDESLLALGALDRAVLPCADRRSLSHHVAPCRLSSGRRSATGLPSWARRRSTIRRTRVLRGARKKIPSIR